MRISMDSSAENSIMEQSEREDTFTPDGLDHSSNSKELLSRTTLETHKLDMMAEISQLKLRLATSDKRSKEMDRKLTESQRRIDDLQSRLNDRTIEVSDLRVKSGRNGTVPNNNSESCGDIQRDRTLEREKTLDRLKRKHSEVDRLKKAVESLVAANDEKEKHIDDLRKTMQKYKRLEEVILSTKGRKVLESLGLDDERSDTSSNPLSSTSSQDHPLREYTHTLHHSRDSLDDYGRRTVGGQMPAPSATSTPVSSYNDPKHAVDYYQMGSNLYATTPPSVINNDTPRRHLTVNSLSIHRSNSAEDVNNRQKTPSTVRKRTEGYGTLPKDLMLSVSPSITPHTQATTQMNTHTQQLPPIHPQSTGMIRVGHRNKSQPTRSSSFRTPGSSPGSSLVRRKSSRLSSFSRSLFRLRPNKWTTSAPNLVGSEVEDEALKDSMAQEYKALASTGGAPVEKQNPTHPKKHSKGLRRLFSRLRRTNSQELDEDELEDFKRCSALRSTAGPRLGWSRDLRHTFQDPRDMEVPFSRWDSDRVNTWLHHLGFSQYGKECRRWVKNGQQLLKATSHDLEKDFGIKNYFHRKKLLLHVQAKGTDNTNAMDDLDHNWVTRWLDDVGLPQYKTEFSQALIDGRVLNFLTIEDLRMLTVVNTLHLLSLKRAIQVLRQNHFNPIVLKRRPSVDELNREVGPADVILWTNHRVMEWLRTIDLSEYAPNLRGSGVHGALMVLEPKFGAEIFATILSIPPNKTLLRRHLSTHFVSLIGQQMQQYKRELEGQPGFIPLTPNQKIKARKFNLFSSHRRARSENDVDDYVCPLDEIPPVPAIHTNGNATKIQNQNTGKPVTSYSNDLSVMTQMLSKETFMDEVPTSNV